jgi:peptidoglycan hydrolase CwlO-like protein
VTDQEDIATVAGQLADLTRAVRQMADQLQLLLARADSQQERVDIQQERIDLAAKELAEVSDRLQAAANALRASV